MNKAFIEVEKKMFLNRVTYIIYDIQLICFLQKIE